MQLEYEKDPRRWDITIIPKFPPPPPPLVFANDPSTKGPKDTVDTSDSEDSELVYPKPKRLSQEVKILKRQQSVPKTPPSLPSKSPTSSPLSRLTSHSESPQSTKQTIHRTLSSDNGISSLRHLDRFFFSLWTLFVQYINSHVVFLIYRPIIS
jgi:hypothetical protein